MMKAILKMLPFLLLACNTHATDLVDSSSVLDKSLEIFLAPEGRFSVEELDLMIANTNLAMDARKRALASLLGWHLPLNCSSQDAARVFTNPQWLHDATVVRIERITGWLPVDLSVSDVYQIRPFPSNDFCSFDIYIGISGMTDASPQGFIAFLEGRSRDSQARIVQFALHWRSQNDSTWVVVNNDKVSVTHEGEQHRYQLTRWGPRWKGPNEGAGAQGQPESAD